ncbi:MAG: lysylphosphatidylglycerol synthase transmembrane domain-containing protein [Candidatus Ratteibacteria bacterium]
MKNNRTQILIKSLISIFFIYLLVRMIDFPLLKNAMITCYAPLAILALLIAVLLSFPLALRWYILLKGQVKNDKIRYINLWKFGMVGMLFNNFLPTGAGGDIVKVFYLVREEKDKLLIGSSVLIDRFIGAFTVITMGVIAGLLAPNISEKTKLLLLVLLLFLLSIFIFFSYRTFALFLYSRFKRFIPNRWRETLKNIYTVFNRYFSSKKTLFYVLLISFLLQSISILNNYIMARSLMWNYSYSPPLYQFFIFIPLIWTATLIPSIGGLGVREFTYVYFFQASMGKENAFALSIIFLISIFIQSIIGGGILLFLKER